MSVPTFEVHGDLSGCWAGDELPQLFITEPDNQPIRGVDYEERDLGSKNNICEFVSREDVHERIEHVLPYSEDLCNGACDCHIDPESEPGDYLRGRVAEKIVQLDLFDIEDFLNKRPY